MFPKHWWLEAVTKYDEGEDRARVVEAHAMRMDCARRVDVSDCDDVVGALLQRLCDEGAAFVWTWDISFVGAFLDYHAVKNGLPRYDVAEKRPGLRGHSGRVSEACWDAYYTPLRGLINFKCTLARSRKTHENRGGKVGALHTVEYRGLGLFFPQLHREEIESYMKIEEGEPVERGARMLARAFEALSAVVGEDFSAPAYLKRIYTIGGAARRFYLRLRYPGSGGTLGPYHKDHFCDEDFEDYFRERRLQLAGMCVFPEERAHDFLEDVHLNKYDVNGLYTATANTCGEISYPRESTWEDFIRDRDPAHVYIAVFKDFIAYRKEGMPNIFEDPFSGTVPNVIHIVHEYAMFRELYDALKNYYEIEEFDLLHVFVCQRRPDPAMEAYNEFFDDMKERAGMSGDVVVRRLAKSMLNNLIGKFLQKTKYETIEPYFDEEMDKLQFRRGPFKNNWKRGHFDFIRGAYIYTMARVKVMNDIAHLCAFEGERLRDHHFYTDTDSIVTDSVFPPDMVDPFRIGAYKLEKVYNSFGVIGKKVYFGSTDEDAELTCAGIPKGLVLRELRDVYGDSLTPREIFDILISGARFPVPRSIRCRGGAVKKVVLVSVTEIDVQF